MRYLLLALCFLVQTNSYALSIKDSSPKRYVVKPGDTLWSIACQYLDNPWEWKTLWHANPQIHNPNRLYPGAVLVLGYANNQPFIKVLSNGTVKLSPYARASKLQDAIPAIPLSDIRPFLDESLVLDKDRLEHAPYVVSFSGERTRGGQGDEAYVKKLYPSKEMPEGGTYSYAIYRQMGQYLEPETHRFLGFKTSLVGYAELLQGGEPARINITNIIYEGIKVGDRVVRNTYPEFDLSFEPQAPLEPVKGAIIDMPGGFITQAAVGQVVVLDRGRDHGLKPGVVVGIFDKCRFVNDPERAGKVIAIPPERIGDAMVFRTFTHTSFALVVRSVKTIKIFDGIGSP